MAGQTHGMDAFVFFAVLAAAACHAGWNALLKLRLEPLMAMSLIAAACALVTLPFVPVFGLPALLSWPYLAASVILHFFYYVSLAAGYRAGDLGQVYPIARGTAPLMTALGATLWVGEDLGLVGWLGITVLAGGILLLSVRGGRRLEPFRADTVGFALLTAVTITGYTLVDGLGARLAGSAGAYIIWLFILDGVVMVAYALMRAGAAAVRDFVANWPVAMLGGALSTASYGIAIWAMTVAPIALVAALRETSVLFASLIGIVLLREPALAARIVAAVLVVTGVLLVRFR